MKFIILFVILSLFPINVFSQSYAEKQGIEHFKHFYEKQDHLRNFYKLSQIDETNFQYHEDTISIDNNEDLRLMVKNGLLHPIYKNKDNIPRKILLHSFLEIPSEQINTKRFKIWIIQRPCRKDLGEICLLNPTQFYFEIESNCIENCHKENFYKQAKLTYLSKGGIIF